MVLTKRDLDDAVTSTVELMTERFTVIIEEKLTGVLSRVSELEVTITNNQIQFDLQAKELQKLSLANDELRANIDLISQKLEDIETAQNQYSSTEVSKKIKEVEERLEERTNRGLRQTLVFRGVREQKNESWEDTFEIVVEIIAKNMGISQNSARSMLNRVHRGRPSDNADNNSPRPIYAAMFKWYDCENIIDEFRDLNIHKKSSIRVSYMYGPLTTKRRGLALIERKRLKELGVIVSGYISYPAKLFAKVPGGDKYNMIKDFSSHEVTFNPRN